MEKIKLLLYCTKNKPYLLRDMFCGFLTEKNFEVYDDNGKKEDYFLNGKIIAECDFEVEKIPFVCGVGYLSMTYLKLKSSCLTLEQFNNYLNKNDGYAIHINNLNIFDKPKELQNYLFKNKNNTFQSVEKAPQNMMYIKQETIWESGHLNIVNKNAILISIRPEWICKILNGEKTIEVRKKVLKEMM